MKPVDNDVATKLGYSKLEAHEYPNMANNKAWESVSSKGQNLVLQLMERDPAKRLSAAKVRALLATAVLFAVCPNPQPSPASHPPVTPKHHPPCRL
jgi:hypothetical protein